MLHLILQNIDLIEKNQDKILDSWMHNEIVNQTLRKNGFEVTFFKEKFASKVLEFAISVVKSENKLGSCPVIGVMLLLFKKKNIPLSDIFMICIHLKNTLLTFMHKESLLSEAMIEEIALLMDYNFKGVIDDYVALYYSDTRMPSKISAETEKKKEQTDTDNTLVSNTLQTTSAQDYLQEVDIDMGIIQELDELESDTLDAIDSEKEITQNSLLESANLFEKYAKVLNMMYEFDELSYTLTILKDLLNTTALETIDKSMLNMISVYLKAIISDLRSWRMGIFITHEVEDIHYLDKTLMSSIAQLEVLLLPKGECSDEDEIEFF